MNIAEFHCFTKTIYVGAQKLLFMIINIMVINNNNKKKQQQRTNKYIVHLSK